MHNDDSRGKRLNPAGYWAQKYEESKAAQVELETKVTECEREIERLRSELRVEKGARTIRVTPTTRRRKDAPSSSASSRTRKRPRLEHDISDVPSMETVDNTLPEDTELLSAVSAGTHSTTATYVRVTDRLQMVLSWYSICTGHINYTKNTLKQIALWPIISFRHPIVWRPL